VLLKSFFKIATIGLVVFVATAQCVKDNELSILRVYAENTNRADSCYMDVSIERFDAKRNDITRINENLINERRIYGTDGVVPHSVIEKINIRLYESEFEIGRDVIGDCVNPRYDESAYKLIVYNNSDAMLIFNGSDGAGTYTVILVVSDGEIVKLIDNGGIILQKLNL